MIIEYQTFQNRDQTSATCSIAPTIPLLVRGIEPVRPLIIPFSFNTCFKRSSQLLRLCGSNCNVVVEVVYLKIL